ncbi:MAG TPA: cobyrinate a,c-diamide synthase [Ottowia sp.]|nr:cobyrinate a,c-diamide synthase [Ottowia sp.]
MVAAVLIAAPASGQGKTTVAAALARLHARQGRRVRCFKCGPDFLDPLWLQAASGHAVDSLDLWINGETDCAHRLAVAATQSDLLIVEGVMGLFDGEPSAADLAQRFGIPVLVVIDASAMAGTFAALAHGLQTWRPALPWAGVLANRVGSARHAEMLRDALRDAVMWQGHLPRQAALQLPERHLGLTMPRESADALTRLDAAADALAATPLGQRSLSDWPQWQAPAASASAPPPAPPPTLRGQRIAIARDAAFAFIYPANLAVLEALGAELVFFSPLAGDTLPPCGALWLPGGYPELHAAALSARHDLRDQIASHIAQGRPVWAECGGMMALADRLVDGQGTAHPMWGLLPGAAVLGKRLAALGPHVWTRDGDALRGHSFHWSRFDTPLPALDHTVPARGVAAGAGEPVLQRGSLRASWFHPWFASSPAFTARLFSEGAW